MMIKTSSQASKNVEKPKIISKQCINSVSILKNEWTVRQQKHKGCHTFSSVSIKKSK
jgi:hypothetical protein